MQPMQLSRGIYRLGARLESFSFGLTPEQIGLAEGLRAAVAVAVMVMLAFTLHLSFMAWAAFGSFWCCLADPGGPDKIRLRAIGGFALGGALALPAVSIAASHGVAPGAAMMLLAVFLANLPRAWGQSATLPGVLASVVAVVGVDYPRPPQGALLLDAAFLFGCAWALLLCLVLWRIHPHAPLRRAIGSIYVRLGSMTADFLAETRRATTDAGIWQAHNAAHRRAVRLAIERARIALARLNLAQARHALAIDIADSIFATLIALGHQLGHGEAPPPGFEHALRRLHKTLLEAARQTGSREFAPEGLAHGAAMLAKDAQRLGKFGAGIGLCAASLAELSSPPPAAGPAAAAPGSRRRLSAAVLRHAARVSVGVAAAYVLASWLHLAFSYWATMATVVVMQPAAEATWPRSLERIIGSIAGGALAALLLALLPNQAWLLLLIFPLAAATIALKGVNYTLFVTFLTPLFILVVAMLQPGDGIPAARALNNVLGALVGAAATMLLWPEHRSGGFRAQLATAISANLAFAAQALNPASPQAATAARRAAGMASNEAETALARRRLEGRGRAQSAPAAALLTALRDVAGAASITLIAGQSPHDPGLAAQCTLFGESLANRLLRPETPIFPPPACPSELGQALGQLQDAAARLG